MAHILINNIKFNYNLFGEGTNTIVFISGYTCDINFWLPIANQISKRYQVLTFDNQGIGKTQDSNEPLHIEQMARNIKKLFDKLEISKPILAGFAMGTSIALEIAYQYPGIISKLILLSPVRYWDLQAKQYIDDLIKLRQDNNLDEYFKLIYKTAFGTKFKQIHSENKFIEEVKAIESSQTLYDQKRQANALKNFDCRSWVHMLKGNDTIIISPKEDCFAKSSESRILAKIINAKYQEIDCGHSVITEEPEILAKICKEFLYT